MQYIISGGLLKEGKWVVMVDCPVIVLCPLCPTFFKVPYRIHGNIQKSIKGVTTRDKGQKWDKQVGYIG